jgi:hypothetical protein
MSVQEIIELYKLIASVQTIGGWIVLLLVLYGLVASFLIFKGLGKYAEKRGEMEAITDQFEELKKQLKENTEVVAKVNAVVSHDDWMMREWKARRREKLETLLTRVYELEDWLFAFSDQKIFGRESQASKSPMPEISLISLFYAAELSNEVLEIKKSFHEMYLMASERAKAIISANAKIEIAKVRKDVDATLAAMKEAAALVESYSGELHPHYQKHLVARNALATKAQALFNHAFVPQPVAPTARPITEVASSSGNT